MTDTLRCPGCLAELMLPALANDQRVQCPRCQHTVDPARPVDSAVTARPTATAKPVLTAIRDDDLPADLRTLIRRDPLHGEWAGKAAMMLIAISVLSFVLQIVVYSRQAQLSELWLKFERVRVLDPQKVGEAHAEAAAFEADFRPLARTAPIVHHVTFWPATAAFLLWLFQVSRNLRSLKAIGVSHRPLGAVVSFFVPVMQFFRPYVIVQEIWQASDPDKTATNYAWFEVPESTTIRFWWTFFVAGNLLSVLASLFISSESWRFVNAGACVACVANALLAMSGVLLLVIIHQINARQILRYGAL